MMNKNRIKLLQEYFIDTTLRLIAEVAVWSLIVFYLYFYFPNSRFLSTRAATIARNGYFMLLVPVLFVMWGLPRILRYARLFGCLVWDLIERKTVSGNLKGMGATGPHRFLLTAKKQYADITKGWVYSWKAKGWKKADGKPALNVDLWEQLLPLLDKHQVELVWVKGHQGHPENERCDKMAVAFYNNLP